MPRTKKTTKAPAKTPAKTKAEKEDAPAPKPRSQRFHLLKGFKDIMPEQQIYWNFVFKEVEKLAKTYGFGRLEPPILEETNLYVRSVGKQSDIVTKEMFSFIDTGKTNVTLRPEATASIARAYTEHGMFNQPQPVKVYYWGPMFRREKPQKGRQRQFYQFGFETIGSDTAVVDAQLILIFKNFCQNVGLGCFF